jgi:hypothetical protein
MQTTTCIGMRDEATSVSLNAALLIAAHPSRYDHRPIESEGLNVSRENRD